MLSSVVGRKGDRGEGILGGGEEVAVGDLLSSVRVGRRVVVDEVIGFVL